MQCTHCHDMVRLDDQWTIEDRIYCGACAWQHDPEWVQECNDEVEEEMLDIEREDLPALLKWAYYMIPESVRENIRYNDVLLRIEKVIGVD